jgi:hypothetical protein
MSLIVTLPITSVYRVNIFQGSHGKYYCIQGDEDDENTKLFPIYYDIHFPLDWIIDEEDYYNSTIPHCTGPIYCKYCKEYGYYNGVFIGYCNNCAEKFDYKRGNGFIINPNVNSGEECINYLMLKTDENNVNDDNFEILTLPKENSIWETYLKDVTFNDIGDIKLAEDRELYKDMPELISHSDCHEDNEFKNFDYNNYILEHDLSKEYK